MLDARDLTIVRTISMPGSVLGMHWDAQLNQIFVAAGGSLLPSAHLPLVFPPRLCIQYALQVCTAAGGCSCCTCGHGRRLCSASCAAACHSCSCSG